MPVQYTLRNLVFESDTGRALPVTFNHARGCLRVMDPIYRLAPRLSDLDQDLWGLSGAAHMAQVLSAGGQQAALPSDIFGHPEPNWCYYYEKADLARQFAQWQEVSRLGAEAAQAGFEPKNGAEWLPFIIADANQGAWASALARSRGADGLTKGMRPALCEVWNDFSDDPRIANSGEAVIRQALTEFECLTTGSVTP